MHSIPSSATHYSCTTAVDENSQKCFSCSLFTNKQTELVNNFNFVCQILRTTLYTLLTCWLWVRLDGTWVICFTQIQLWYLQLLTTISVPLSANSSTIVTDYFSTNLDWPSSLQNWMQENMPMIVKCNQIKHSSEGKCFPRILYVTWVHHSCR